MFQASKRWIVLCAVCMCALALPAAAGAAEQQWQFIADPAPGSVGLDGVPALPPRVNFVVSGGEPYLAVADRASTGELRVYRAERNRTWRELSNGPLNPPGSVARADMTSSGGGVWIAWSQSHASATPELHVAQVTRTSVRELPGSTIVGASDPQIAWFGGRLYISYWNGSGTSVVRTRARGRGYEQLDGLGDMPVTPRAMDTYRGRLFLSVMDRFATVTYWVLNRRGTGLTRVDDPPEDLFVPRLGSTTFSTAGAGGQAPGAPNFVLLFATRDGVTEELPNPAKPGNNVSGMQLLVANGTLWASWVEGGPSDMSAPQIPHVARLVRR
jgi:hypothetical protein